MQLRSCRWKMSFFLSCSCLLTALQARQNPIFQVQSCGRHLFSLEFSRKRKPPRPIYFPKEFLETHVRPNIHRINIGTKSPEGLRMWRRAAFRTNQLALVRSGGGVAATKIRRRGGRCRRRRCERAAQGLNIIEPTKAARVA